MITMQDMCLPIDLNIHMAFSSSIYFILL